MLLNELSLIGKGLCHRRFLTHHLYFHPQPLDVYGAVVFVGSRWEVQGTVGRLRNLYIMVQMPYCYALALSILSLISHSRSLSPSHYTIREDRSAC